MKLNYFMSSLPIRQVFLQVYIFINASEGDSRRKKTSAALRGMNYLKIMNEPVLVPDIDRFSLFAIMVLFNIRSKIFNYTHL